MFIFHGMQLWTLYESRSIKNVKDKRTKWHIGILLTFQLGGKALRGKVALYEIISDRGMDLQFNELQIIDREAGQTLSN